MPKIECCLLLDPPAEGAWNMAVDEVLLEWSAEQGGCAWRFYGWQEPTLSLGYFQDYRDRFQHSPSVKCAAVRRLTGGGAIIHEAELTYSFVAPAGHPLAARRDALYATVHSSLIEALAEFGIHASPCATACRGIGEKHPLLADGESASNSGKQCLVGHSPQAVAHRGEAPAVPENPAARDSEPFLCFQRRAPDDVLLGSTKIAGSAQRRRRGAVLQHGSVLLGRSAAAPELPGLEDLAGKTIPRDELCRMWLAKLALHLGVTWCPQPLAVSQRARAAALRENRYSCDSWVKQRNPRQTGTV